MVSDNATANQEETVSIDNVLENDFVLPTASGTNDDNYTDEDKASHDEDPVLAENDDREDEKKVSNPSPKNTIAS